MTDDHGMTQGRPWPLGVTPDARGANVAVFSAHATRIECCLFDAQGRETHRLSLPEREGDIWFGHVAGLRPGQRYGLRAHGAHAPEAGHRFNPNKLLVDPYARRLSGQPVWHPALMGYEVGHADADLSFDTRDSAPYVPKGIVTAAPVANGPRPHRPLAETIIYEAHVKGLTQTMPGITARGTFPALAEAPVIDHLTDLGITALELLPVHTFITDKFLADRGMENYWGYQTLGYFAPDPRYLPSGDLTQIADTVARLHDAGIEVLLDVVYNHTCEGDEFGPTLSFRGLDNASYYRLADGGRYYVSDTGTGNTVRTDHPMVLRMVMDSLRYWVQAFGIDGFRFDLGATLGRRDTGFDPRAPLFDAMRQDPVLVGTKLIMEPWDIGPGGYQLGQFPVPFSEWNDRFRDTARRAWRGDTGQLPDLAGAMAGSADLFDHGGRSATASVNLITAHDGFTLRDLVTYTERRNAANGEDGRDGHGENLSDNLGHEGPTDDPAILSARGLRRRSLIATLLVSQGVPMILAGDEIGNSQGGNNNAYAMDNPTGWIDWSDADAQMLEATRRLIAIRQAHPVLRQARFLHSDTRTDGTCDLVWRRMDWAPMAAADWEVAALSALVMELRMAADDPFAPDAPDAIAIAIALNTGAATQTLTLPAATRLCDTAYPDAPEAQAPSPYPLAPGSVAVFSLLP